VAVRGRDGSSQGMDAWLHRDGPAFLRKLGIASGDCVLDFGCGPGGYALPLAQVVGRRGRVIAVDKNADHLELLRESIADYPGRDIVEIHQTDGSLALDWIADRSLDVALLFDVLQHVSDWDALFASLQRKLRPGGLLLANPSHLSHPGRVDVERMKGRLAAHGFALERIERAQVMHYDFLHEEEILALRSP
jgi:ubiquinone/menaquinone biosynthesis C-methylase UbiE